VQGGLRLAATLNAIFEPEPEEDVVERGLLDWTWLVEAESEQEGKRARKVVELA
jgi:hypothetical protein